MRYYTRIPTVGALLFVAAAACSTERKSSGAGPDGGYVEPAEPAWTFCTNDGEPCTFTGLRDVRLGAANGPYVIKEAFGVIPCAPYGFDDQDPAPGQPQHCDYGPTKRTTITNPSPGMGGLGETVVVPMASPGASGPQLASTSDRPEVADGSGAFRTTCSLAAVRFDDPVVYPGRPGASHLHVFFGNTAVTGNSTPESIASSGNSTCRGGTLNRTAYWAPALIDSRSGNVVTPDEATFYYKTGYNIDPTTVRTFPAGLRMIAGNKNATGAQDFVAWSCRQPDGGFGPDGATVPTDCRVGDHVRLEIIFPQCWDGVNLDSPDHQSHMAYPIYRNTRNRSTCPASHPVTLPEITEFFDYKVTHAAAPAFWRLTSDMYETSIKGGLSAHADWVNGWDPQTMQTIVTKCLNAGLDCGVGSIGNGTTLY